jgi:hypothetical protein
MKTLLSLGVLALLAQLPVQAQVEPLPGKIGVVNVNLLVTTQRGGFNGDEYKVVTDKENEFKELYKTVAQKQKYANSQFIADLLAYFGIEQPVAGFTIRFVIFENGFEGYFLANKDNSIIRYLGAHSTGSNYGDTPFNTYYATDDYHDSTIYTESSTYTEKTKNGKTTRTDNGSYKFEAPGTYIYFNFQREGQGYFECFSLAKGGGSFKGLEIRDSETDEQEVSSYVHNVGASTYTGIVGTDYDGALLTGSMTVAALKAAEDLRAFYDAYEASQDE